MKARYCPCLSVNRGFDSKFDKKRAQILLAASSGSS